MGFLPEKWSGGNAGLLTDRLVNSVGRTAGGRREAINPSARGAPGQSEPTEPPARIGSLPYRSSVRHAPFTFKGPRSIVLPDLRRPCGDLRKSSADSRNFPDGSRMQPPESRRFNDQDVNDAIPPTEILLFWPSRTKRKGRIGGIGPYPAVSCPGVPGPKVSQLCLTFSSSVFATASTKVWSGLSTGSAATPTASPPIRIVFQ